MEDVTNLIETAATLVGVLSWPLVVIFLAVFFGRPLRVVMARIGEFSFKAGPAGLEASAKIQELREKLPAVDGNTTTDTHVKVVEAEKAKDSSAESMIDHRHMIEQRSREVYLVHVIESSKRRGQLFDVFIYLTKHRSGTLSDISYAEFFLGRHWANKVFRVEGGDGLMGISISAYGPVLCTCRVVFKDGREAMLERYIDFEMANVVSTSSAG